MSKNVHHDAKLGSSLHDSEELRPIVTETNRSGDRAFPQAIIQVAMHKKDVMAHNSNQPRADDAVLGGQTPAPVNGVVLGGLAGVRRRLLSPAIAQRVAAVKESLKYGQSGLDLVIEALKDESWQVRETVYLLLQSFSEPRVKQALEEDNHYQLFQCLYTYPTTQSTAYTVKISPDGQLLASGGSDRTITVRSLSRGKVLRTFKGHSDSVYAIAISPDGRMLVSGSKDNTIKVWNLHAALTQSRILGDGLLHSLSGHAAEVNCVAISPDGDRIATGSEDSTIKLWDLRQGKLLSTLPAHAEGVKSVAISPNGQTLVSSGGDGTIKLWNLEIEGQDAVSTHTLTGQKNWVRSTAISPDGQILASGGQDKTIKLWHLHTGELLHTLTGHHWGEVNSVAISSDGHTLVSGGGSRDETIRLWHLHTGAHLHALEGHQGGVAAVAISPDGQKLVSCGWDQTIKKWGGN